jgi:hypothetical protein
MKDTQHTVDTNQKQLQLQLTKLILIKNKDII